MLIIAHRGFSGRYPENTMLAFQKAAALGVDGIELDVQLSQDNKAVVIHDKTLERTTNGEGRVKDFSLKHLQTLDVEQGQKIPTLEEVFYEFRSRPRLIIELKYFQDAGYEPLVNEVLLCIKKNPLSYPPLVCSFHWDALRYLQKNKKNLPRGVLYRRKSLDTVIKIADEIKAEAICVNIGELNRNLVQRVRQHKKDFYVWTINTGEEVRRCQDLKVAAVIGNDPDMLLEFRDK